MGSIVVATIQPAGRFELEFGSHQELRQLGDHLAGKSVVVMGTLQDRAAAEVPARKIITVTELKKANKK